MREGGREGKGKREREKDGGREGEGEREMHIRTCSKCVYIHICKQRRRMFCKLPKAIATIQGTNID